MAKNKVFKSVKNKKWTCNPLSYELASEMAQLHNIPNFLAEILASRNIGIEEALSFLDPKLKTLMPDPLHLLDMDQAIELAAQAVTTQKKIAVFGDYDVDGATSSALLKKYFRWLGLEIMTYIPDRISEGYGPNVVALQKLKDTGIDLVITVDCGASAFEPLAYAREIGLQTIVLDHHIGAQALPAADAVVNPHRADELSDSKYLAAVGVCFLFVVALTKLLRESGFFYSRAEPNLVNLLDLVALGTVCDQVPLVGLNRAFVRQGLKILNSRNNTGLKALLDQASLSYEQITAYHLGFVIGPRINAGGRVGQASLGCDLLASDDYEQALSFAEQLSMYNNERKAIEMLVLSEAQNLAEKIDKNAPLIFVASENWHPGVIGIVAGRLKEKYNKPVAVVAIQDGVGKASCRSINGIDFGKAIIAAKELGLLVAGGGHAMAAGFTVETSQLENLQNFLHAQFFDNYNTLNSNQTSYFDNYLTINAVNMDLVNHIEKLGPFGTNNYQPRFMVTGANIVYSSIVGSDHISCVLSEHHGGSNKIKAIAFRALDSAISEVLLGSKRFNLNLIVNLNINRYNGKESVEMVIHDLIIEE